MPDCAPFSDRDAAFRAQTIEHPDRPAGFVGLAREAMRQRAWSVALERWQACFERFAARARPEWQVGLARALLALGRLDEAAALYRQTIERTPHDSMALQGLAVVAARMEQAEDAAQLLAEPMKALERSLELVPDDRDARLGLGFMLQCLGRLDAAIALYAETIRRWQSARIAAPARRSQPRSAPRIAEEVHLVSNFAVLGGGERRCIELFKSLEGHCRASLWSPSQPHPLFAQCYPVQVIDNAAGRYPQGGTIATFGARKIREWIRFAQPERLILIYNHLTPRGLMRALENLDRWGVSGPELVYASELMRRATSLPGIVEPSLIDISRFVPRARQRPAADRFAVGRVSRDTSVKHHPRDPGLYRRLIDAGCRVRLMGATVIEPRLGSLAGMEIIPVEAEDVAGFLQGLDCFFYRTSYEFVEANGRVVHEAMACGLPVVCHRNGGYRDVIDDGRNGFLFDGDAEAFAIILRLKADRELRRRIGEAARRTAEAIHGPAARRDLIDFYLAPGGTL
jgi:glycosyltransferase involved in cell wall biosynthesis